MKKNFFYLSFIIILILCIILILTPYYIAYLIIEPNSFLGVIGVFLLGSIIIPIILGFIKLIGINLNSLINGVKERNFYNTIETIHIDSSNKKTNRTNLILIILLIIGILVFCTFFINIKKSQIELPSSHSNTDLKINENAENAENAEKLYQLGLSYTYEGNYVKAAELIKKSAELGYAEAQYNLGIIYETGEGIPQDNVKSIEWTRKAAEQGYANAQFSIAMRYFYGRGVPKDNGEAIKWLVKAANQGDIHAQQKLKEIQELQ